MLPTVQALRWMSEPYALLDECAEALGDTFTLPLGASGSYVIVSRPADVATVFGAEDGALRADRGNDVLRPFLGPGSLLVLDGAAHRRERRILMPAFGARRVAQHRGLIQRVAESEIRGWKPGEELDLRDAMERVSMRVILSIVLGPGARDRRELLAGRLARFLGDPKFNLGLLGMLDRDLGHPSWRAFRLDLESIRAALSDEIERRRAGPRSGDIVSMLLDAKLETGESLAPEHLVDEILTLLVTGFETTATALAWAFYWLDRSPTVRDELRAALATTPARDVPDQKLLDAVCREVLRIHPVIPIVAREVVRPLRIGSWELAPGTVVAPCAYLVHRDPTLYPDPRRFDPSRFLERKYGPVQWFPFGGGQRRCIGASLALLEMKLVIACVLGTCDLALVSPDAARPRRRSVTVAPAGGPRVRMAS